MRTSPLCHAVAGALLCSTAAHAFQEVPSPMTHGGTVSSLHRPNSRSSGGSISSSGYHGPLHLAASRANDNGVSGSSGSIDNSNSGGRRSPGYVPFGGTGSPYIPGRGSREDDEEWFARQVQMAEQERGRGGGQPYGRFGSQRMRSQPGRPERTPTSTVPGASRFARSAASSNSRRQAAAAATNNRSSSTRSTTRRTTENPNDEPRPTIGTPTQTATSRNSANQQNGANRNSRAPQSIASGSSAVSSWFRGGNNRSSRNGIQMPGAEQVQTPTESMARLSGPRPVTRSSTTSPVNRTPMPMVTPGDAMRADTGAVDARQPQQQRPKSTGSWFNDQLMQQQFERERQQAVEEEFGSLRPGGGGNRNRNASNSNNNRNRPPTGYPSLPQPIGAKGFSTTKTHRQNILAYIQSAVVGAFVGTWSVFPFTAFHYLVFSEYTYTTFAQWEWDMIAASVQASCFAVLYRYALRLDWDDPWIQRKVTLAAVLLRSVVRVTVPFECAAGKDQPLFCVDSAPLYMLNDKMTAEIVMNAVEGLAMFGVTALAMSWLLERNKIAPYRGD